MVRKRTEELMKLLRTENNIQTYLTVCEAELLDMTVGEWLCRFLEQYSIKKADVIRRSGLNRIYGYQIFADTKTPSRDKLIALIFGFPLPLEDANKVLKIAKVRDFYVRDRRDSILVFGLMNRIAVHELDDLLYEMGEPTILS